MQGLRQHFRQRDKRGEGNRRERYVKIKSFTDKDDGLLYISCENDVAPDYDEKKKSRNGEHGYGLRILRDTAENTADDL